MGIVIAWTEFVEECVELVSHDTGIVRSLGGRDILLDVLLVVVKEMALQAYLRKGRVDVIGSLI